MTLERVLFATKLRISRNRKANFALTAFFSFQFLFLARLLFRNRQPTFTLGFAYGIPVPACH